MKGPISESLPFRRCDHKDFLSCDACIHAQEVAMQGPDAIAQFTAEHPGVKVEFFHWLRFLEAHQELDPTVPSEVLAAQTGSWD